MTQITAKVVAASISYYDKPIYTLELQYPRFVHSEFMTHRVFSRNAASSRAIPVAKMIEQVRRDPAMPVHWGKNQPGMQAHEELVDTMEARQQWQMAARQAADRAEAMAAIGLHKQICNRVLEPFQLMKTIVTSTEWDNFFNLRAHLDAQPEIQTLAVAMRQAIDACTPARLLEGEWHLPYVLELEVERYKTDLLLMLSTARCARVSYLTHDGQTPDIDKDIDLYQKLMVSEPRHASPAEHQAKPAREANAKSGNFIGWIQHRQHFETSKC